jgi:hypothetical protein
MKFLKPYTKFNEGLSDYQIEQLEEDKNFISDTLLELKDKEFRINVEHNVNSIIGKVFIDSLSITEPMPILIIGAPENSQFQFSDVKDELLQIKSYLDDRWYKCGVMFNSEIIDVLIDEKDYDNLDDKTSAGGIFYLAVFFNI